MRLPFVLMLRCLVMAAAAIVFAEGADIALDHLTQAQNDNYLRELNQTVLRRAEGNIADAQQLLAGLTGQSVADCSDASMVATRLRVYQNNLVKDIRVLDRDGNVRCSAYSDTLEFDKTWTQRSDMLGSRDPHLSLFRVERFFSDALGVLYSQDDNGGLAAIVGIDAPQFDILPDTLRNAGQVSLVLDNGRMVAAFGPGEDDAAASTIVTSQHSTRFPIRTEIRLPDNAMAEWNQVTFWGVPVIAGTLGLLIGWILARPLGRPPDPISELDRAVINREFAPFFQPIFCLKDRTIIGCEALMRWIKPDGRVIGPGVFMPLAESSGRIEAMTWLLLERALQDLQGPLRANPHFKLSINIVPRHLLAADFLPRLQAIVKAGGASPSQIVLEITERDELADLERAASVIAALQASDFRVAIDDVGVGHSGLSYIQSLQANTLKIDKFFVDSLAFSETARAVIVMLVSLARELGMTVVAEGIETDGQIQALQACLVDEGQGYVVAPPLPANAFLSMVAKQTAAKPPYGLAA